MSLSLKLYQVDAFSDGVFGGNPAGICVLPDGLWPPDNIMMMIARENNLSETAFLLRPPATQKDCDYLIRWFAATEEVNLCGHATLAAALVVEKFLHHGTDKPIRFVSPISGPLPVEHRETPKGFSGSWFTMRFPADNLKKEDSVPQNVLEALNLSGDTSKLQYFTGKSDQILVLASPQAVLDMNPDLKKLSAALAGRRALHFTSSVPSGTTKVGHHNLTGVDFVLRFFGPMSAICEDPVTGSAFCSLAPLWSDLLKISDRPLVACQISTRGGLILSQVNGPLVDISGANALYLDGTIFVPSS